MKSDFPITLGIFLSDEFGKNVSINKTYNDTDQWFELMDQFIATLNAYGYIIKDRHIYINKNGIVEDKNRFDV